MMSPVDTVALAHRLEELVAEYKTIDERMGQIRQEAQDICAELDGHFKPFVSAKFTPSRPRPLDDRLSISLGRTVVKALRLGWDRQRTIEEAPSKTTSIAQRNGLAELPPAFVHEIEKTVSDRIV